MVGVALMHLRAYPWRIYGSGDVVDDEVASPVSSLGSSVEKGEGVVVREVSRECEVSGGGGVLVKLGFRSLIGVVFDFGDYWKCLRRGFIWVFGRRGG